MSAWVAAGLALEVVAGPCLVLGVRLGALTSSAPDRFSAPLPPWRGAVLYALGFGLASVREDLGWGGSGGGRAGAVRRGDQVGLATGSGCQRAGRRRAPAPDRRSRPRGEAAVRVDAEVVLDPADPADGIPPRTITRAGVSVRMNRVVDARSALRLSGSGMERLFVSFAEHRLLCHADFVRQLDACPTEQQGYESCGTDRLFVYGRRTKERDTRLLVVRVEGFDTVHRAGPAPGRAR